MSDYSSLSASPGTSNLSTGAKIGIAVLVIAVVVGTVLGLVFGGVFSSSDEEEGKDDPPVQDLPTPNTISEVRVGDKFESNNTKLLGSDGSSAIITNNILTIKDENGQVTTTVNQVDSIELEFEYVSIKYVSALQDTTFPITSATLIPTNLGVLNGAIVCVFW